MELSTYTSDNLIPVNHDKTWIVLTRKKNPIHIFFNWDWDDLLTHSGYKILFLTLTYQKLQFFNKKKYVTHADYEIEIQ